METDIFPKVLLNFKPKDRKHRVKTRTRLENSLDVGMDHRPTPWALKAEEEEEEKEEEELEDYFLFFGRFMAPITIFRSVEPIVRAL